MKNLVYLPSHRFLPKSRKIRYLADGFCIMLVGLSIGCSPKTADSDIASVPPTASATIGNELDDSVVTTSVKAALLAESSISSTDFKVETSKGSVQLSGFANEASQIERAVAVAQGVAGVKEVQNRMLLKVGETSAGSNVDDAVITGRVKAALLSDKDAKSTEISVETRRGEVILSGFVSSKSQTALAEMLAAKQEGVKTVRNELSVKN
jgi:hyperosmotically inducible periplasmic protein